MRIIGGHLGGLIVCPPANMRATRPTTDKARESLFNILSSRIATFDDVRVLDLFSGTGMLAYEFLSRGAAYVDIVEKNARMCNFIATQLARLSLTSRAHVHTISALTFLSQCTAQHFDIIFADPPYDTHEIEKLHGYIFSRQLLCEKGIFIVEHRAQEDLRGLDFFKRVVRYGDSAFSFFAWEG